MMLALIVLFKEYEIRCHDLNNYNPITRLPLFSKLMERVCSQHVEYIITNDTINRLQNESIETVICIKANDIFQNKVHFYFS